MSAASLSRALQLSRQGDVEGALVVLREARAAGAASEAHLSLHFQLVMLTYVDEALEIATAALDVVKAPMARSTWALRRGLIHVERGQREAALADLQMVLKLRASDDHQEKAREALVRVAGLARG